MHSKEFGANCQVLIAEKAREEAPGTSLPPAAEGAVETLQATFLQKTARAGDVAGNVSTTKKETRCPA